MRPEAPITESWRTNLAQRGHGGAHQTDRAVRYRPLPVLIFALPGLNFAYPSELEAYLCLFRTFLARAGRFARAGRGRTTETRSHGEE